MELSGGNATGGLGPRLVVDFENSGSQAIDGWFDAYARSSVDSLPHGPIPEPASATLLLASLAAFGALGTKGRQRRGVMETRSGVSG